MEKQNAPIKPMNGDIVGQATANKTAAVTITVLRSEIFICIFIDIHLIRTSTFWWRLCSLPHDIVDQKWTSLEIVFDSIPADFQAHEELKTKRTIHSQCDQYTNGLCRSKPIPKPTNKIFCLIVEIRNKRRNKYRTYKSSTGRFNVIASAVAAPNCK